MWMWAPLLCASFVAIIGHLRNKLDVGQRRQNLFYPLIMLHCMLLHFVHLFFLKKKSSALYQGCYSRLASFNKCFEFALILTPPCLKMQSWLLKCVPNLYITTSVKSFESDWNQCSISVIKKKNFSSCNSTSVLWTSFTKECSFPVWK